MAKKRIIIILNRILIVIRSLKVLWIKVDYTAYPAFSWGVTINIEVETDSVNEQEAGISVRTYDAVKNN